jgi:hypothetical protein
MVFIPEEVEPWLRVRLPNIITRTTMQRKETSGRLVQILRESIVNALIHRDYDLTGAKCQLLLTGQSIQIKSPGGPLPPITLEQLQSFSAPMLSRNPQLHYVFTRMGLSEERGLGMSTLRSVPDQLGLPVPQFTLEAPYLVLRLYSSSEAAVATLAPAVLESFNDDERNGWKLLTSKFSVSRAEYAEALDFDVRKAQRQLTKFVELGLLRRTGRGPAIRYEVIARPESATTKPVWRKDESSTQPPTGVQRTGRKFTGMIHLLRDPKGWHCALLPDAMAVGGAASVTGAAYISSEERLRRLAADCGTILELDEKRNGQLIVSDVPVAVLAKYGFPVRRT